MLYFAMIPNGWGTSNVSVEEAYKRARIHGSVDRKGGWRKTRRFCFAFPDETKFTVSEFDGAWTASKAPLALLDHKNLPEETVIKMSALINKELGDE